MWAGYWSISVSSHTLIKLLLESLNLDAVLIILIHSCTEVNWKNKEYCVVPIIFIVFKRILVLISSQTFSNYLCEAAQMVSPVIVWTFCRARLCMNVIKGNFHFFTFSAHFSQSFNNYRFLCSCVNQLFEVVLMFRNHGQELVYFG